ncbi:DUF943 family protein [Pseudescherichia vulneris]|uniref:DUF943 family protein n=1 Tax=Pseudescherichia vulneris TaxID=566 RepID=UPI0030194747
MKSKNNKILFTISLVISAVIAYIFWRSLRPVDIVDVHQEDNYSSVLVRNFPITDKGKIEWWLENKDMLKSRYGIPKPASYGGYDVTFWLFDDGYKEEGKYDRLCFNDMKGPVNCIEKDAIFSVDNSPNLGTVFTVYDGGDYRFDKSGKLIKIPSQ